MLKDMLLTKTTDKTTDITYYGASKTRQLTDSLAVCSLCHKDRDVSPQGLPLQFFSVLAAFKQGFF